MDQAPIRWVNEAMRDPIDPQQKPPLLVWLYVLLFLVLLGFVAVAAYIAA